MSSVWFVDFVDSLQDQYDNIAVHTQKGIEFLERYGNFIRDRCTIELEYAGKLRFLHQKKKKIIIKSPRWDLMR